MRCEIRWLRAFFLLFARQPPQRCPGWWILPTWWGQPRSSALASVPSALARAQCRIGQAPAASLYPTARAAFSPPLYFGFGRGRFCQLPPPVPESRLARRQVVSQIVTRRRGEHLDVSYARTCQRLGLRSASRTGRMWSRELRPGLVRCVLGVFHSCTSRHRVGYGYVPRTMMLRGSVHGRRGVVRSAGLNVRQTYSKTGDNPVNDG